MDHYIVVPHEGVGAIRLGMNRHESRVAMALPFHTFLKSPTSRALTDSYLDNCFQVSFDETDKVEFIELSSPIWAVYKDVSVFQTEVNEIVEVMERDAVLDTSSPEADYSFIFPALALSLWRSTIPEDDQEENDREGRYFLTIGIGKHGYYNQP